MDTSSLPALPGIPGRTDLAHAYESLAIALHRSSVVALLGGAVLSDLAMDGSRPATLQLFYASALWRVSWLSRCGLQSGHHARWHCVDHDFLLSRVDTLALGAAIAILLRGPLQERILRWAPLFFVLATGGVIGMCVARQSVNHSDPVIATVGFSAIALAYGGVLLLALRRGSWAAWFMSLKVLRLFGKYSYGIYLYDLPLTVVLSPRREFFIARLHSYGIGSVVFLIFCVAVNLLVAAASFHLIESPIMRLKSRFKYA